MRILSGTMGAASHEERLQGFKDTIAEYPDIEIVDEQRDNDAVEKQSALQNPGFRHIRILAESSAITCRIRLAHVRQ